MEFFRNQAADGILQILRLQPQGAGLHRSAQQDQVQHPGRTHLLQGSFRVHHLQGGNLRLEIFQHGLRPVFLAGEGGHNRSHRPGGNDHLSPGPEERKHADRLPGLKAQQQVRLAPSDHGGIDALSHAKVAEDTASPLGHTDGFRGEHRDIPGHGCRRNQAGSQDGSLTAHPAENDVLTHGFHLPKWPPRGTAGRRGRSRCTGRGRSSPCLPRS